MRLLFALMTLLHFQLLVQCTHMNVRMIIVNLERLDKDVKMNTSCTLSALKVPGNAMQDNAKCCVPEFKNLTRDMLSCVTVPAKSKDLDKMVLNDLELLHEPATEKMDGGCVGVKCISMPMATSPEFKPFTQYVRYLRKLNKRRRRTT